MSRGWYSGLRIWCSIWNYGCAPANLSFQCIWFLEKFFWHLGQCIWYLGSLIKVAEVAPNGEGISPKGRSSNIRYFESQQLDTLHNPIWTNVLLTSINYTIIKPKPACFHATVENYVLLQKIGVAERSPTPAADH